MRILLLLFSSFLCFNLYQAASSSSNQAASSSSLKVSSAPWNSSEVDNCLNCWGKHGSSAYYCNNNNALGYCCNGLNTTICSESSTTRCSSNLTYANNKYGYCLKPSNAICGTTTFTLNTTNATNVSISKLASNSKNGSVC